MLNNLQAQWKRVSIENELLYLFLRNRLAQIAALVAFLSIFGAIFAPLIAPTNPYDLASFSILDSFLPPAFSPGGEARFLIGTDDQGRDLLSSILYGTRLSLLVGLSSVLFASVLGTGLGLAAGYIGGRFDAIVMRIADVQLSLPAILTALLVDGVARGILPRAQHEKLLLVVLTVASACRSGSILPAPPAPPHLSNATKNMCRPTRSWGFTPSASCSSPSCRTSWVRCWSLALWIWPSPSCSKQRFHSSASACRQTSHRWVR